MKRKIFKTLILAICMCPLFGISVSATELVTSDSQTFTEEPGTGTQTSTEETATPDQSFIDGYNITVTDGLMTCTYNGVQQKNVYLAVKKTGNKYTVVKPLTKESVIYYFNAQGTGDKYTGNKFIMVTYENSKKTYFSKQGTLQTNAIVGNKSQGYYYVDSTGIKATTKEMKQAVKFVRAHTKTSWSKSKKLKACYDYLWKNYTYERFYDSPNASKMSSYAGYMFTKKRGNCFRYAASLAYIARVIGYDSRVVTGQISSLSGGMTPHGWAEIKIDGQWYICDANMQRNYPSVNSYMRTEKTYPYRHNTGKKYKMTVKNGKVTWK